MQTFCYNCLWSRSFSPEVIKGFRWDFSPITHWLMSTHHPLLESPMRVLRLRKTLPCQEKFFARFLRKHFPLQFVLLQINICGTEQHVTRCQCFTLLLLPNLIWPTDISAEGSSGLGNIARQSSVVTSHELLFAFGHWKEGSASYVFRQLVFEGLLVEGGQLGSLKQFLVWNARLGSA